MKNYLEERYKNNRHAFFQRVQTGQFVELLGKERAGRPPRLRSGQARPYNKVLEVGCGRGYWSYVGAKAKRFKKIFGCDTKDYLQKKELDKLAELVKFEKIRTGGKTPSTSLGAGPPLPYKNNFFDLVFSMDVIEHVEDDINFIKENIRVCKKGGEIIIGTPNLNRAANIFLKIMGRLKFPMNLGKDYYGDCIHLREYTDRDLADKIILAGKGKIHIKDIQVYPCWLGILQYNLGIEKLPGFLKKFCQFWFIKIKNP